MKKIYSGLIISFVLGLGIIEVAKANDSAPNITYWIKDEKITCLSVVDPENLDKDYFLVFDYSPRLGEKYGRPWAVLEKGKCYEINEDGGAFYRVKIVTGNERQEFRDYSKFNPADDIVAGETVRKIWPYYDSGPWAGSHFSLTANKLFPTKYDFGAPMTFHTPLPEELLKISRDPNYIKIDTLYSSLAKQLESTIRACDARIRVERQISVMNQGEYVVEKNVVWSFRDKQDFSYGVTQGFDQLSAIDLIGCRAAYTRFVDSHRVDFNTVDQLAEAVIKKYPKVLAISQDYGPIIKRDEAAIQKINAFVSANEQTGDSVIIAPENTVTATPLDTPTPARKIALLFSSGNPLMFVYIFLPLAALIGIVVFLLTRKRKK